jgi:diguanylate cyclase (GGDEF)-like protein
MGIYDQLSISKKSLRCKLMIAFSITSILPLLVLAYFVTNHVFSDTREVFQASVVVIFCLWLIWMGYLMIREVLNPIFELAQKAKKISAGEYDAKISLSSGDELADIAGAVNSMTDKMRSYIGELQEYGKRTTSLNARIQRKVLTLTSLMRLGDIISSGADFEEITAFAAKQLAGEMDRGFCAIFIKEDVSGYILKAFADNSYKGVNIKDVESRLPMIDDLLARNEYLSIDSDPRRKPWQQELRQKLGQVNAIFFPMKVEAETVGIILAGTFGDDIKFTYDDLEVVRAFDNELVLGYQNASSAQKIKSLEVVDRITGLYSFQYIMQRLEDEINRAIFYQRPCSLVVVTIDDLAGISSERGQDAVGHILRLVARLLGELRPPVGKLGSLSQGEFALLVPEMNKKEGLGLGESIRARIEEMSASSGNKDILTVSVGVGENPIDGSSADEIMEKSRIFVRKAQERGGNRVVGE